MKKILAVFVLLAMAVSVATAADKGKPKENVSQIIMDQENEWAKQSAAGNAEGVGALLTDDAVLIDTDGKMYSKAESMARTKKSKWDSNTSSDMKVTVRGNTAVVTGVWKAKGVNADGKTVDETERFADTWVKMPNGKWLCMASASAPMK